MTPRLPAVTPRQAVRALERCGWQLDRIKEATTSSATQSIDTEWSSDARP